MKGVYTANVQLTGITTGQTLIYLTVPFNRIIEIISATVTNKTIATTEQFECGLYLITLLGNPTATRITPLSLEGNNSSFIDAFGPVTANEPTYSTVPINDEGWLNVLGYRFTPYPENRPYVQPSTSIGLRYFSTPLVPFDAAAEIVYREIG